MSSTLVRIVTLEIYRIRLGVGEGIALKTSLAATALSVAVDKLLLRELQKFTRFDFVLSLHGSDGAESPTGTAVSLVLNFVDSTGFSPVFGWPAFEVPDLRIVWLLSGVVRSGVPSSLNSLLLGFGPSRELVVVDNEGVAWLSVDSIEFSVGLGEQLESELELFDSSE